MCSEETELPEDGIIGCRNASELELLRDSIYIVYSAQKLGFNSFILYVSFQFSRYERQC
jgi:hypothetical protein